MVPPRRWRAPRRSRPAAFLTLPLALPCRAATSDIRGIHVPVEEPSTASQPDILPLILSRRRHAAAGQAETRRDQEQCSSAYCFGSSGEGGEIKNSLGHPQGDTIIRKEAHVGIIDCYLSRVEGGKLEVKKRIPKARQEHAATARSFEDAA
jgi:hypothetical protein